MRLLYSKREVDSLSIDVRVRYLVEQITKNMSSHLLTILCGIIPMCVEFDSPFCGQGEGAKMFRNIPRYLGTNKNHKSSGYTPYIPRYITIVDAKWDSSYN